MVKGVIFDMDGVLVDNRDVHVEAYEVFSRRHGVQIDRGRLLAMFGRGNDEILPAVWPAEKLAGADLQALGDEKEAVYRDIFHRRIEPAPGLVAFLDELRRRGYRLAVGSSGPADNVAFVLERCGIAGYFDAVVDGDMVARRKPEPDVYLLAARMLGLPPGECLVIEDAPAGVESARRAGMRVAVLATTFPRSRLADYDMICDGFRDFDPEAIAML